MCVWKSDEFKIAALVEGSIDEVLSKVISDIQLATDHCIQLKEEQDKAVRDLLKGKDVFAVLPTAAQMWCLSRFLPLLIGDVVPESDKRWQNFLMLMQIEDIVFAPKTTIALAAYLDVLVGSYLEDFANLYERPIIPKQRYMIHYPSQIVRRGPLLRNWAMRFEAKHNYFKRLVGTINNFKNIELSLTRRHQALQTYLLQSSYGHLFNKIFEHGPIEINQEGLMDLCPFDERIIDNNSLKRTTWVKVMGTKYSKYSIIVTGLAYGIPVFGQVIKIYITGQSLVLLCYEELDVIKYIAHMNAYQVPRSSEVKYVAQDKLFDYHPLAKHNGFGQNACNVYIVMRYRVDCMLD